MNRFLHLFVVLIIVINGYVVCYGNECDVFFDNLEKINFDIKLNDKFIPTTGYIFHEKCFVDIMDFIKILGYRYNETNYIKYDDSDDERIYFCKIYRNNEIYYLNFENKYSGSYYDLTIRSVYAEKFINGIKTVVFLSDWEASDYVEINEKNYVNICAIVYLLDDMEYMTKIDMDNNEVVIKKYNKEEFVNRVREKYNVEAYSVCNGSNEYYHSVLTDNEYGVYSGLDFRNAKEQCKKLLEHIWSINTDDIYLKYDSSLDIYVATAKGNIEIVNDNYLFSKYSAIPKMVIRAFDGMVLYPY